MIYNISKLFISAGVELLFTSKCQIQTPFYHLEVEVNFTRAGISPFSRKCDTTPNPPPQPSLLNLTRKPDEENRSRQWTH